MQEIIKYIDAKNTILDWAGKRESALAYSDPVDKVLVPCKEESLHFDSTENLFIEGDNLDVLKLLRKNYSGKIKLIYIDPPYNTGKNFVYRDNFINWLSMIYPRLVLARDLLAKDGAIFISIDDGEHSNLKSLCDEVFGGQNFVANIIWQRSYAPVNLNKYFSTNHDFILCFAKDKKYWGTNSMSRTAENIAKYTNPDNDPRGRWVGGSLSVGPRNDDNVYPIKAPSGRIIYPPDSRCWRLTEERFQELLDDNRISFGKDGDKRPRRKCFFNEITRGVVPLTVWPFKEVGHSTGAAMYLKSMFGGKIIFDYSKPVKLLEKIVHVGSSGDDIVLDFFAGSGTTAEATVRLNAKDGGNRKYIMVQIPDKCAHDSEAFREGFSNIAEISKERIRRAVEAISGNSGHEKWRGDVGFRVLRCTDEGAV